MTIERGELAAFRRGETMANQTNTIEHERDQEPTRIHTTDRKEIREALMRLRMIGEELPPVDAAAVVREGRALAEDRGVR